MDLMQLLERLKMDHLLAQLEGVCEQAAKGDLDYQRFLADALEAEWRGRQQRGIESRLKLGSKRSTNSTLSFSPRLIARWCGNWRP
jgi:hypothetical protein